MHEAGFDLATLLRPVEAEAFLRDFWERQPLQVERDEAAFYRGLFALSDLDAVLAFSRPRFAGPDGLQPGTKRNFVQGLLPDDEGSAGALYPDVAAVHRAFAAGKTLILTAMQLRWAPVAALCRRLEGLFNCPVHTNLYLTPGGGSQGFDAHYDTHEVFVLQIEGVKHWRLYGQGRELPLPEERATYGRDELGPPTRELLLRPGDLLYLPRGHIHEASTGEGLSLHLTVGVKVLRWADLLRQALDDVSARDARLRASLPPGLLTADAPPADLGPRLRELLAALAEAARPDAAVGRLAAAFLGGLTALPGGHFAAPAGPEVGLDTVVERTPGVLCRVVVLSADRVGLHYAGGSLEGPAKVASALRFVARAPLFAARDLPDDLTDAAKLVLVRRLVRDRFLVVVGG
jgi:hypothetical protein